MSPNEFDTHLGHDHIAAVFPSRGAAEGAVETLRGQGLGSEHLGIAVHDENPVDFEHDAEAELVHDAKVGVATGAPLGALAGFGVAALVATGVGAIGVGGVLAASAASALWGGMLGGFIGTAKGDVAWEEHEEFGFVPLDPGEVLVVVCSHGEPDALRSVLHDAGGRLLSRGESGD